MPAEKEKRVVMVIGISRRDCQGETFANATNAQTWRPLLRDSGAGQAPDDGRASGTFAVANNPNIACFVSSGKSSLI
jgi:hypothetical protein